MDPRTKGALSQMVLGGVFAIAAGVAILIIDDSRLRAGAIGGLVWSMLWVGWNAAVAVRSARADRVFRRELEDLLGPVGPHGDSVNGDK